MTEEVTKSDIIQNIERLENLPFLVRYKAILLFVSLGVGFKLGHYLLNPYFSDFLVLWIAAAVFSYVLTSIPFFVIPSRGEGLLELQEKMRTFYHQYQITFENEVQTTVERYGSLTPYFPNKEEVRFSFVKQNGRFLTVTVPYSSLPPLVPFNELRVEVTTHLIGAEDLEQFRERFDLSEYKEQLEGLRLGYPELYDPFVIERVSVRVVHEPNYQKCEKEEVPETAGNAGSIFYSHSFPPRRVVDNRSDFEKEKERLRNLIWVERDMLRGGSPHTSKERISALEQKFYGIYGEEV